MKSKITILTVALILGVFFTANSQIEIAVAKDSDGSHLRWQVVWGKGSVYKCGQEAKNKLRAKGYDRVVTLEGESCCGHNTSNGYWVVVSSTYQRDGKTRTSFGMGASSFSSNEAKERALKNLGTHDWVWNKSKHGYQIEKKGTF